MKFIQIIATIICINLMSCTIEQCEEDVPVIEIVDLITTGDTAQLTISFKDCDGDLGLHPWDTAAPYEYNLFLEYFEYKKGEWNKVGPLLTPYYYRIPKLENSSNSTVVEGEMDIHLIPYYLPGFSDTLKYELFIVDSALNKSNVLETPILIAPPQ